MGSGAGEDQPIICAVVDPQPVYVEGLLLALHRAGIDGVDAIADALPADGDTARLPEGATIVIVGITGAALVQRSAERVAAIVELATRSSARTSASIPVLVLADATDPLPLSHILRAGAVGVIDRAADPQLVTQGIRQAAAGQVQFDAPFAARLAREVASSDSMPVSPRELEVLRLMAEGLANQQIADRLFISLNTVKNHIRSIHEKLGVRTRTAAVSLAARQGWISNAG